MPDINVGSKRRVDRHPRATKSDHLPLDEEKNTDPATLNLSSLIDIQFKPMFMELYERGRGDIAAFTSDFLGVTLHDAQVKWVHSYPWCNERMLSCGNRWGKSMVSAMKILHHAFYQTRPSEYASLTSDYICLNLSLTIDMSRIVFDYAMQRALDSPMFSRFVLQSEIKTAPFPIMIVGTPRHQRTNGFRSEVWARSSAKDARYLLGRKFDFVVYDECARDPRGDKILDEVLRMRLADRAGRIDMTSTASGKNWFYSAYNRSSRDPNHLQYFSMTGTTYDNPHINRERVEQNEAVMSRVWKDQNIFGGFSDYANVFDRVTIELAYAGVEYPICGNYLELDQLKVPNDHIYLMAVDWALKRDETVMLVADVSEKPARLVYAQGFSFKPNGSRYTWDELQNAAVMVHRRFHKASCLFDSTGMAGEMIMQDLTGLGMNEPQGYDFAGFQGKAKDHLIVVTQQALQNRVFEFPYSPATAPLVDQLLLYDRDDRNLSTDWTFAFALLCENFRRSHMPASEVLDAPFIWALSDYKFGFTPLSRESRELKGIDSNDPFATKVLTNEGWREI